MDLLSSMTTMQRSKNIMTLGFFSTLLFSPMALANYGHYEQNGKGFMVDLNSIQYLNRQKDKFSVTANLIGVVESNDIPKNMLNQVESKANLLIDCKAKTLAFQSVQVIYKPNNRVLMENDQPNFSMSPSKKNKMEMYMIEDLCKYAQKH